MAIVPSKQIGATTATEPFITNVPILLAATEYSHVLNDAVKQVIIRCRESATIQYCFVALQSNSVFMTLPKHNTMGLDLIKFTGKTLYFRSDVGSVVLEVLELI